MKRARPDRPVGRAAPAASAASAQPAGAQGQARLTSVRNVVVPLLLALAVLAVYAPALRHDFLSYDDPDYVTENARVQQGLTAGGVAWAFTTSHASNYWHPLTWLSHMLDCQLHGLDPGRHHLTSLLLHAANTVLLFLLFVSLTGRRARSAFVAALFAFHPLHVESVAWIAERKDVLCAFFWLAGLLAYARYAASPSWKRYVPVLLLFLLGILSKPMIVTFPFTLLLLDYWPLGRLRPGRAPDDASGTGPLRLIAEKAPLFALAAAAVAINLAMHPSSAFASLDRLPLTARAATALVSCAAYIGKMFWPSGLAVLYIDHGAPPSLQLAVAAALLAGISLLVGVGTRRHPWLGFGWLWFLGTLVPVIGLVKVGSQAMADRYTYIPLIGLFVIVAWGTPELIGARSRLRSLLPAAVAASAGALALATVVQLGYWKNSEALYQRALAVTTGNWIIQYNLANSLLARGDLDGALAHYREAVRANGDCAEALAGEGNVLLLKGLPAQAEAPFARALALQPGNLIALDGMGQVLMAKGEPDGAIAMFRRGLAVAPGDAALHESLGLALEARGFFAEAAASLREALRLDPRRTAAREDLPLALNRGGRAAEAAAFYREVLAATPDDPGALNGLAWILATTADPSLRSGEKAVDLVERAAALLAGETPSVIDTRAAALAEAGRFPEAVTAQERAIALLNGRGGTGELADYRARLELYRRGAPYREHSPAAPPR